MGDCTSDESITLENARYTRLGYNLYFNIYLNKNIF